MSPPTSDRLTDRLAYSVEEAAQVTGLSRDLLYDEMRAGRLAYLKVGRRRIITRQHLEAFLAQRSVLALVHSDMPAGSSGEVDEVAPCGPGTKQKGRP